MATNKYSETDYESSSSGSSEDRTRNGNLVDDVSNSVTLKVAVSLQFH